MAESTAEFFVLHVNGTRHEVRDAWLGESLLFVLRERLGLRPHGRPELASPAAPPPPTLQEGPDGHS